MFVMSFHNPNLTQDDERILQKQIDVEYKDILEKKKEKKRIESAYTPEEVVVSNFAYE